MSVSKSLSFAELIRERESSVKVTDDGLVDVINVIMVLTGKDSDRSKEVLSNLSLSVFNQDKIFVVQIGEERRGGTGD